MAENKYLEKVALTIDMGQGRDGVFRMSGSSTGRMPVPVGAAKVTAMPNPRAGTALANPMKVGVAKPTMGMGGKLLRGAGLVGAGLLAAKAFSNKDSGQVKQASENKYLKVIF